MGIKRLKKVFVITGDENSGKTRCIKELARMFAKENYEYTDFLHTTYGEFLNQNYLPQDMNDDIFGYFHDSFDTIGIISAGDNIVHTKKCLDLLYQFQPDVIICAARDKETNDAPDFDKIEEIIKSLNDEFLTAVDKDGKDKLKFPDNVCEEFSISEILPKNEKAGKTCNDSSDDNSTKQSESTAQAECGSEKEEQESDELKTLDDLFEEIKSAIRGFDSVVVKKQTK